VSTLLDNFDRDFGRKLLDQMFSSSLINPVFLTAIKYSNGEFGLLCKNRFNWEFGDDAGLEIVEKDALAAVSEFHHCD
jgi:hypothetical protein